MTKEVRFYRLCNAICLLYIAYFKEYSYGCNKEKAGVFVSKAFEFSPPPPTQIYKKKTTIRRKAMYVYFVKVFIAVKSALMFTLFCVLCKPWLSNSSHFGDNLNPLLLFESDLDSNKDNDPNKLCSIFIVKVIIWYIYGPCSCCNLHMQNITIKEIFPRSRQKQTDFVCLL